MKSVHTYQWKVIRKQILNRDGHTCTHCGNTEGQMEVDHIIPRHRGGDDTPGNLQTLCQQCHIEKTKKDSSFLGRKGHPSYPATFSLQKSRMVSRGGSTKAIEGDSEAFGLGLAGE